MEKIEQFLAKYADEIPPANRAALREAAAKFIAGKSLDDRACPAHLRFWFSRACNSAVYISRCKPGEVFRPGNYDPTQRGHGR